MVAPTVKVEMWLGGGWVDLVELGRVDFSAAPVSIARGRANEVAQVGAGQCSFTLANDDGAFTPEHPASPWRSSLVLHRMVRVQVQRPDLSWSVRYVGWVDDDPVDLPDPAGVTAPATITAVDRIALMGLKQLRCQRDERILALNPKAFYPLDDSSGATQTNDVRGGPQLVPTQVGSGGTLEFGSEGGPVTAEGAGSVNITRGSATAGLYLLSDGSLGSLGVEWSMISTQTPTTSGYLWKVQQGTYILGLYWSSSTSKYSVRQYNGSAWSTLATSSVAVAGLSVEVVSVTATTVTLRSDATHTAAARAAATFTSPTLAVGWCADSSSGFDDLTTALISGVAVVPGALTSAAADALATGILAPPSLRTDEFMAMVMGWAGMPVAVSWLGAHPALGLIPTNTQSPQSLADTVSQGAGGRFAAMADGSLCWVDRSWLPALSVIPAEAVNPGLRWARDRGAYVTEVTTSLPSGGSYTYTATSDLISESKSITGVLPTDQACKDAAALLVAGSSLSPRLSAATFDLLTQPDPDVVSTVLALDVGAQVALVGLPPQVPDAQSLVIEGVAETIGLDTWTVTINTSPSSQSLPPAGWYFAWVDDPATFIDHLAYIANQ